MVILLQWESTMETSFLKSPFEFKSKRSRSTADLELSYEVLVKILEHLRRGESRLQKFAWEFDVTSTLVYENLEKHCSHYLMLDQRVATFPFIEQKRCPQKIIFAGSESVQEAQEKRLVPETLTVRFSHEES